MARRSSRRATKRKGRGLRLGSRAYAPVRFVLNSTGHIVKGVAGTAGKMASTGFKGMRNIGTSVVHGANKMVRNVTRRR
jgi:hypothetical protein